VLLNDNVNLNEKMQLREKMNRKYFSRLGRSINIHKEEKVKGINRKQTLSFIKSGNFLFARGFG
jgi:hypothetical protein